jgi:soluble cytochrome b562
MIDGRSAELLGILLRNKKCVDMFFCSECPISDICKEISKKQPRIFNFDNEFKDDVFNEIIKKLDEKNILTKDQLFEFLL